MQDSLATRGPLWEQEPEGPAPGLRYANLVERIAATLVDYLAVVVVAGVPYAALGAGDPLASPQIKTIGTWLVLIAVFVFHGAIAAIWNGQAIGGRLLGLRIVKRSDGSAIGWGRALLRPVGVFNTAATWLISVFAVLVGKERRTPADALTGTVVIKRAPDVVIQSCDGSKASDIGP